MEGFFDGLDVMSEAMASATPTATQGVPAEAPIPSTELVPRDEGTHIERLVKLLPFLLRHLLPKMEPFLLLLLRLRLPLLPHLSLSLPVILSQLYLRP